MCHSFFIQTIHINFWKWRETKKKKMKLKEHSFWHGSEKAKPKSYIFRVNDFLSFSIQTSIFQIKRCENVKCQFYVIPHHLMGLKMRDRLSHTCKHKHFQHTWIGTISLNVFGKPLNHLNHRISFVSFDHLFTSSSYETPIQNQHSACVLLWFFRSFQYKLCFYAS